jgi:hypothetical protein
VPGQPEEMDLPAPQVPVISLELQLFLPFGNDTSYGLRLVGNILIPHNS